MSDRQSHKSGDVLLGCVHKPNPYNAHIYMIPGELRFKRPDGTTGEAKWIVLCCDCDTKYGDRAAEAPIGCEHVWPGHDVPCRKDFPHVKPCGPSPNGDPLACACGCAADDVFCTSTP